MRPSQLTPLPGSSVRCGSSSVRSTPTPGPSLRAFRWHLQLLIVQTADGEIRMESENPREVETISQGFLREGGAEEMRERGLSCERAHM